MSENSKKANKNKSYQTGLRTMTIMVSVGISFALLQIVIYVLHNKRVAQGKYRTKGAEVPMIYRP